MNSIILGIALGNVVVAVGRNLYEVLINRLFNKLILREYKEYFSSEYTLANFIEVWDYQKKIEALYACVPDKYTYRECELSKKDGWVNVNITRSLPTGINHPTSPSYPVYSKIDFYYYMTRGQNIKDIELVKETLEEYKKSVTYNKEMTDIVNE